MTIGARMKKRRKELGISADDIANYIGVDRTTYYRYERGAISKVSTEVLQKVAEYLHTTPTWLMGIKDASPIPWQKSSPLQKLSDDEADIITKYRCLNQPGKDTVRAVVNIQYDAIKKSPKIGHYDKVAETVIPYNGDKK